jgi:putative transposase
MFHMQAWGAAHAEPAGRALLERLAQKGYPRGMDTKQKKELERREKVLAFWEKHGPEACRDAFGVSRRTLFRWKADAEPGSRAHRNGYARRSVPAALEAEILRLRGEHPKLGKEKLQPLLAAFCRDAGIPAPAEATVGRILAGMRAAGRLSVPLRHSAKTGRLLERKPAAKKEKLRRDGYVPALPGDLLQVDGVTTFALGSRRYTFTAVDLVSRWAYSRTYASATGRNGADFLGRLLEAAPFAVRRMQTDNGGEFLGEFRDAAEAASLTHYFNWARQPKYQGWVERYNRTVQEEFLDWRHASLSGPVEDFNPELEAWLAWYNGERVHRSLGKPCQRLAPLAYLAAAAECQTG